MKPNIVPGNDFWSPDMFAANKVAIFRAYKELSKEGHVGDPTKASAGLGKKVFEAALMHRGEL
jgi:creatinine amidohydrolase